VYFCRKKIKKVCLTIWQFNVKLSLLRCSGLLCGETAGYGSWGGGRKLPGGTV